MKIIDLQQNSEEWLSWRKSRITATDASVLNGSNPFKEPMEIYNEKLSLVPPQQDNEKMKRGRDLEPIAREKAIKELKKEFIPIVIEHQEHYWAAASLDGYSVEHHEVLEIKCPSEKTHKMAIEGTIPPYYFAQIQWQLFCSNANCCFYFSYCPEYEKPISIIQVKTDPKYIENLFSISENFYKNNLCVMEPPAHWKFKTRL